MTRRLDDLANHPWQDAIIYVLQEVPDLVVATMEHDALLSKNLVLLDYQNADLSKWKLRFDSRMAVIDPERATVREYYKIGDQLVWNDIISLDENCTVDLISGKELLIHEVGEKHDMLSYLA